MGVAEPVLAGSYLFESYGEGWVYRFYEEDGRVVVKCSPVKSIQFVTLRYPLRKWYAEEGATMTEAYSDPPKGTRYVRATVVDALGRRAWTNPLKLR